MITYSKILNMSIMHVHCVVLLYTQTNIWYILTSFMSEGELLSSDDNRLNEELIRSVTPFDLRFGDEKINELGGDVYLREDTGEESHDEDFCLSIEE